MSAELIRKRMGRQEAVYSMMLQTASKTNADVANRKR